MSFIFVLLFMAYAQDKSRQPTYIWAGGFGLLNLILGGEDDVSFLFRLIASVIMGLYAWGYFALLRHFTDQVAMWLMICVAGLLLPFFISLLLT